MNKEQSSNEATREQARQILKNREYPIKTVTGKLCMKSEITPKPKRELGQYLFQQNFPVL